MLKIPISPEPLVKASVLQRMTKRWPRQHYFARAKNRVIAGPGFAPEVAAIDTEYAGSLTEDFKTEWVGLLEKIIASLARDGHFDPDEKEFVKEFIRTFGLTKPEIESAYRRGVTHAFSMIVRSFASDGELTDDEWRRLDAVAARFGLVDADRATAVRTALASIVEQSLDEILRDELISDDEWASFQSLCQRLGIDATSTPSRRAAIDAARERWRVLHGELQPVEVSDFRLPPNERAYARYLATMFEQRRVRVGGEPHDQWTAIVEGELLLTNQRIVMRGANANNKAIKWSAVASVEPVGRDGFLVEKYRGKSPFFRLDAKSNPRSDLAALIARRLFDSPA